MIDTLIHVTSSVHDIYVEQDDVLNHKHTQVCCQFQNQVFLKVMNFQEENFKHHDGYLGLLGLLGIPEIIPLRQPAACLCLKELGELRRTLGLWIPAREEISP